MELTKTPDLAHPDAFARVYDDHHRAVFAAAYRIVGNVAQAEDVAQDVFLRLWRRPERFDAARGELGSYLRLMARSRALDVYRESQALGRASDRLQVVVDRDEVMGEVMNDPRVKEMEAEQLADMKQMRYGGFVTVVDP